MRERIEALRKQLFDKDNKDLDKLDQIEKELISIQNVDYIDKNDKDLARWTQRQLRRKYTFIKFPPQFGTKLSPAAAMQVMNQYGSKEERDGRENDE